jgi:RNA polymerase sigma-70 factor (ECF subfamily)
MNDAELISDFLNGDKNAFELLFSRYNREVFYLVKTFVNNTEEAKDITQDAFIKAFNNLKNLNDRTKFKSWLFTIGVNLAKDRLKMRKKTTDEGLELIRTDDDPHDNIIKDSLAREVNSAIKKLPERQADVIRLRALDEMSFKEIAQILNIKETTVRTNFHFAIKGLRDLIFAKEENT